MALASAGLPGAAAATEMPLGIHKYRTVDHWCAHHAPWVHFGYYWYRWGWRWGRHPVFLVRNLICMAVKFLGVD